MSQPKLKRSLLRGVVLCIVLSALLGQAFGASQSKGFELHTGLLGEQREYLFDLNLYDEGGMTLQAILNLNQFIALGVGAFADGVIGSSDLEFYVPGVFVKVRLTDNPPESWNLAFGYDLFQIGSFYEGDSERNHGLFGAFSKGLFFVGGLPSVLSLGVYYPVIPENRTPWGGVSVLAPLSEFFTLAAELSQLGLAEDRNLDFLNNWSFGFNLNEQMTLSFVLQIASLNKDNNDLSASESPLRTSRSLRFVYNNFY